MKYSERITGLLGVRGHLSSIKATLPYLKFTTSSVGGTHTIVEVGDDFVVIDHASTNTKSLIPLELLVLEIVAT